MENRQFLDLDTKEEFMECRILDGNPSGIINFNKTPHKWAASLYDTMLERTWFPGHINVSQDKAKYGKLDTYQKRSYDLVLAQLISNDSFQTVQLGKINEYITSPVVNACLTRQAFEECVVPETMVLHREKGWTRIDEIEEGDVIFACDQNLNGYFTKVEKMTKREHKGVIYNIRCSSVSQRVTGGHRIMYRDRNFETKVCLAEEMVTDNTTGLKYKKFNKGDLPNTTFNYDTPNKDKPLDWMSKFLIALQADGNIYKRDTPFNYEVKFSFKKERKIKRFKEIMEHLDFYYTITTDSKNGYTSFYVKVPRSYKISKLFKDVFNLSKFSRQEAREFVSELFHWDGWDYGKSTKGYDTTVLDNAMFVTSVCVIAGYKSKIAIDVDNRSVRFNDLYRVSINTENGFSVRGTVDVYKTLYNGEVYCPTVKGGFFLCMLDGKISVTGNCLHSKCYAIMAEDIAEDTDRIYEMHKHDEELMLKNKAVQNMYMHLYGKEEIDNEDLLTIFCANQILEELVFPGGFAMMLSLADEMPGSGQMIAEINTHGLSTVKAVA